MSTIIESLKWRYATKIFDINRKLTDNQVNTLKHSISLTASSLGLQPYKIIVVSDHKIKKSLFPHSYNQLQITTASHLFVFCAIEKIDDSYTQEFIKLMSKIQNKSMEDLHGYKSMINNFINNSDDGAKLLWASKQTYIAIGNLLTTCALEETDACPMEGFDAEKYSEILSLKEKGLKVLALVATGFRSKDDKYGIMPKVRKVYSDLFVEM